MYSNNIVNFQESMTILNGYTKNSGNLLNVPRTFFRLVNTDVFICRSPLKNVAYVFVLT